MMKIILLGFALIFAASPLFSDWSFDNGSNPGSGFNFRNGPNSGSSFSFGNGSNSGSNFSFGDDFNFGNTPNYNYGWDNNRFGYGYNPYFGDNFHRNPVSGFTFGSNSHPYWNQIQNPREIQPPVWMPPPYSTYYPVYTNPIPSPMYYYPAPPAMVKAPEEIPKAEQPVSATGQTQPISEIPAVKVSPDEAKSPVTTSPE